MPANPFKYPRTPHIAGSCATSDDIVLKGGAELLSDSFVVTEKMDGTNIVMTCDGMMTRSGNRPSYPPGAILCTQPGTGLLI